MRMLWTTLALATGAASPEPVQLSSPSGGERWRAGSRHRVAWTAPAGAAVTIEYSADDGRSWTIVRAHDGRPARALPGGPPWTNTLLWDVPDEPTPRARLRVRDAALPVSPASEVAFQILPSARVDSYRWTPVTEDAPFAARDGAGALVFRDRMWLLGGWNPKDKAHFPRVCNSEVWSSADGREWRRDVPEAPWEGRHTAGYALHDDALWIVGGDPIQGHYQNDVWRSPDGVHWTKVTDAVPWGPRALHHTVAHAGRIWVLGGQTMPEFVPDGPGERFYSDVWSSTDGRTWTRVTERAPWSPRGMIGGAAVFAGRIWVLGGGTYDTPQTPTRRFTNDVWSSADGVQWTQHTPHAPWELRQYHDVAVFDARLWVLEGYGFTPGDPKPGNLNDVWYSDDGTSWYELPNTPWLPRHAASLFVHEGALWVVAGNNMTPDVWKLVRRDARGGAFR